MEIFEVPLFDDDLYKLVVRFVFNLIFALSVIVFAYYPNQKKTTFTFTFLLMNIVVFFICFTLKKLELELGMALGLFAIFTILRFRTDAIRVKEMSYLFVMIGIAVINSLSNKKTSYAELVFANAAILNSTYILEYSLSGLSNKKKRGTTQDVVYDNLELLHPGQESELTEDIFQRLGLRAQRVEIKKIDLKLGTANVVVHYDNTQPTPSEFTKE